MKPVIILLAFITCLSSCNTERQAANKTSWLLAHNKLAEKCAEIYPCQVTPTKVDTQYVPSAVPDLSLYLDSLLKTLSDTTIKISYTGEELKYILQENKKLREAIAELKRLYKPCPPSQVIHTTEQVRDIAEETRLKLLINNKDKVIQEKDELITKKDSIIVELDKWKKWVFILGGAIILFWVFRLFIYKRPI